MPRAELAALVCARVPRLPVRPPPHSSENATQPSRRDTCPIGHSRRVVLRGNTDEPPTASSDRVVRYRPSRLLWYRHYDQNEYRQIDRQTDRQTERARYTQYFTACTTTQAELLSRARSSSLCARFGQEQKEKNRTKRTE